MVCRIARAPWLVAPMLLLACAPGPAPQEQPGVHRSALVVRVPDDFATISQALAAATLGDTVQVGPGVYTENVTVTAEVSLVGAGADLTTLRGSVALDGANCRVQGFRVTAVGASGLPNPSRGIGGDSPSGVITENVVDGFFYGIRLAGSEFSTVSRNLLTRNTIGMETFEAGPVAVANNVFSNNTRAGLRIEDGEDFTVVHNTFVGNGFGEALAVGGAALVLTSFVNEVVRNNVLVSNNGGINRLGAGGAYGPNLVWGNTRNYAGTAAAATGDVSVDPRFVAAANGDFRLRAGSAALDVGAAGLATVDFDGTPRPQGPGADLGAFELRAPPASSRLVISEVMANPLDERTGEYVEVYNAGTVPFDLAGLVLSDGDARDVLVARAGGTTVVAPGAYAVIIDPDYVSGYGIPAGVTQVQPGNATLGNGLSNSDPITLYAADGVTVLATAHHPFDPGNGVSAERLDLQGADVATNWRAAPCLHSAGRPNCAPVTTASGLVISEVMANPLDEATGEFVELFNGGSTPIDVAGMTLSDAAATDAIIGWQGGPTVVPPLGYAVVLDRDWPASMLSRIHPSAVLLTVGDASLGNGLSMSDPVTVRDASGAIVDTYTRGLQTSNGRSVEKVSLSGGDALGNWAQSSCSDGSSPGRLNCVSGAATGAAKPLSITEVMANPLDEDTGEFVEIYNRGVSPIDVDGLLLSDGDATDRIVGYQGGTTIIPPGGYAVILDAEYAGEYAIPGTAVKLTTADTTLGSGLAVDDPIRLLEANGVEVIDTFRFPFNPGNGISAERIDIRAFDSPANWTASTCASRSSPGADNCAASASGLPKRLRITEVLANQTGTETGGAGEFVELLNTGSLTVDLAGMYLEIGPVGGTVARDRLQARMGGPTVLAPGAFAVVLDPDYDGRFTFPAGTVVVTISDSNFGAAGIATTHGVALYDADGLTALDLFAYPSDPGDGVSLYRRSLTGVDSAANWAASPCGSTPGRLSCGASGEVTTYTSFWLDADASEGGHYWFQAIGWPEWVTGPGDCEMLVVCTGGFYPYEYRNNFAAPTAFSFTNPYADRPVVFTERASATDTCGDPCTNASFSVAPGATATVPASSLGFYFAISGGPRLNSFDWFQGDPNLYWAIPPDGTLAPFAVEVP